MYQIDLISILRSTFSAGNVLLRYKPPADSALQVDSSNDYNYEPFTETPSTVRSSLGTPVILPVTFVGGRYKEQKENGDPVFINYPDYLLPAASIVQVSQSKEVVKTKIAGADGTFKEYIGKSDYLINIRGLIVNAVDNDPPEQGVRAFNALVDIPQAIDVECEMFEWLGIYSVVIENHTLFQIEGFQHIMGFTLSCSSDNPVEIKLRNGL